MCINHPPTQHPITQHPAHTRRARSASPGGGRRTRGIAGGPTGAPGRPVTTRPPPGLGRHPLLDAATEARMQERRRVLLAELRQATAHATTERKYAGVCGSVEGVMCVW